MVDSTDLAQVISSAIATVEPIAASKDVVIEARLDPTVRPLQGSPESMQQVMDQMLKSAVEHTPSSGRVLVRLEQVEGRLELEVSYSGSGASFSLEKPVLMRAHGPRPLTPA